MHNSVAFSTSTILCNHCTSLAPTFHHPRRKPYNIKQLLTIPLTPPPSGNYLFWIFHIHGIIHYMTFCVWLLSFSMLWGSPMLQHLSVLHTLLLKSFIYVYSTICLFTDWQVDCSYHLVIADSAPLNMQVHGLNSLFQLFWTCT